jgi:hypothetical protein
MIVTRNGNDSYGSLYLDAEKLKASAEKFDGNTVQRLFGMTFQNGTIVRINGINKNTFDHYFQPERLRASLQDMYDPLLRRGELQLYISTSDKKIDVQPVQRNGTITLERIIPTLEPIIKTPTGMIRGTAYASIWLDPFASNAKVTTYNKGVKVLGSLTQLKEFNRFPWNSGKLSGYIDENFCELTPQRDGYMRDTEKRGDKKFATLCQMISSLEPELSKNIREAEKYALDAQTAAAVKTLEEALAQTYETSPPPWKPVKQTEEIITSEIKVTTCTGTATGQQTGTPTTTTVRPSIVKPTKIMTSRQTRAPYPIDIVEFSLDKQAWHSEFDTTYRKILINRIHPDYERLASGKDDEEAWIYFAKLVSNEAALGDYLLSRNGHGPLTADHPEISRRATNIFLNMLERLRLLKKRK